MREAAAVLGAGAYGTALAQTMARNGHCVRLWSVEERVLAEVRERRRNSAYMPGVRLHRLIEPVAGLAEAVAGASVVLITVPSRVVRSLARQVAPHLRPGTVTVNAAKGLEQGSNLRMSQVLAQELSPPLAEGIATMGGPAIARELARGHPTALVVAAQELALAERVRGFLQNSYVRVAVVTDRTGVEVGAALKNVYAIALGLCDGLRLGANVKAILGAAALREMADIAVALGGQEETIYGLAGLGDFLATAYSPVSRNRTLGEKLGRGQDWRGFLETHTVEGVAAARAFRELTAGLGLRLPLLDAVHALLFEGADPAETLRSLVASLTFAR
jgi:glycerol-3-phosphate dehydrogenase (NAD(P)+)